MRLSGEETVHFTAACGDRLNLAAQELLNVFAATSANQVLSHVSGLSENIRHDLVRRIKDAIDEEKRRHRPS
jgi:hypothetical protein